MLVAPYILKLRCLFQIISQIFIFPVFGQNQKQQIFYLPLASCALLETFNNSDNFTRFKRLVFPNHNNQMYLIQRNGFVNTNFVFDFFFNCSNVKINLLKRLLNLINLFLSINFLHFVNYINKNEDLIQIIFKI